MMSKINQSMKYKSSISYKNNIHINSCKSITSTQKRKDLSCQFSFADLLANSSSKITDKEIKIVSQTLSWLKTLKIIKIDLKNCKELTDRGLFFISESLKKLSSVHTLIINFTGCDQITEKGIKSLKESIKRMKFLKKLDFNFQSCSQITHEVLNHLGDGLQNLAGLQEINMNFTGCYYVSDIGLKNLMRGIKRPSSIKSVNFDFTFCGYLVQKEALTNFGEALSKFSSLENLSIAFRKTCYAGSDSSEFLDYLSGIQSLKRINLDFEGSSGVEDSGIFLLNKALSNMESLKIIKINLAKCNEVTDECLKSFEELISHPNLQEIDLGFSESMQITDQGLINIANFLQKRTTFKSISFNFNCCDDYSDKGIIALGESLKAQKCLKTLTIMCEDSYGTDVGFGALAEGLKGLESLESLNFDGSCTEKLTDKFFEGFAESLPNSLKTLKLDFKGCQILTDKGIESLSLGIKKLSLLQHISIKLYADTLLTDETLYSLARAFKTLKYLKSVLLKFEGCFRMTDKGVISLSESLNKSLYLESVNFDFSWCEGVADEALNSLSKCFNRLCSLDSVILNLEGCDQMSDIGISSLKEAFARSSILKELTLRLVSCSRITKEGFDGLVSGCKRIDSLQKLGFSCPV